MAIPKKFLINREEDYHTHYIGKYNNGNQFFGYETFLFKPPLPPNEDWQKYRKEYVVLYIFDYKGNFIDFKYWYAGTTSENKDTNAALELMIESVGQYEFCDIIVKPFEVEIDGEIFGLIPNEEDESIELMPSSTIAFFSPWDGSYDT
ncbi:hypothetical protein [Emticicia fontis]